MFLTHLLDVFIILLLVKQQEVYGYDLCI